MEGIGRGLAWAVAGGFTGVVVGCRLPDEAAVAAFTLSLVFFVLPTAALFDNLLMTRKCRGIDQREVAVSACKIVIVLVITVSFGAMVGGGIALARSQASGKKAVHGIGSNSDAHPVSSTDPEAIHWNRRL